MDSVVDRPQKTLYPIGTGERDAAVVEILDQGIGLGGPGYFRSIIDAYHCRPWIALGEGPGARVCFTIPFPSSGAS